VVRVSRRQTRVDSLPHVEQALDLSEFERLVRDALAHLYDAVYLQTHPLARVLQQQEERTPLSLLGKVLYQRLLDGIDAVRPAAGTSASSKACMRYRIMELRYIEALDATDVQQELAVSKSEYYREHGRALEAVVSALWDRCRLSQPTRPLPWRAPVGDPSPLQREAEDLSASNRGERFDLDRLIHEVVTMLAPLSNRRDVALRVQLSPALPTVAGDRVVLRQAVLSLVRQAVDLISPGDLELRAEPEPDGARLILTAVRSGGTVRPPLDFDLSAARQLLEGLHGRLESVTVDDGIAIELVLPSRRNPTVLVVDNNADFIALVSRYLSQHEWNVVGACGVAEVRTLVELVSPQVILLDVLMPEQDGWDVLRMLKEIPNTRHIPVIICSVLNEPQLALALGADAYLPKPVQQAELLQLLADRCSSRLATAEAPPVGPPEDP